MFEGRASFAAVSDNILFVDESPRGVRLWF